MGRITVFVSDENTDHKLVRGIFQQYSIPFEEINLEYNPGRRLDMINLTNNMTTPQVFFNEKHIGGARAIISLLKQYEKEVQEKSRYSSIRERITKEVLKKEMTPANEIMLRIPISNLTKKKSLHSFEYTRIYDIIQVGTGIESTIGKVTRDLMKWLPRRNRNCIISVLLCRETNRLPQGCKNYFSGREGIDVFKKHYNFLSTDHAVEFGQKLLRLGILHRVENDDVKSNLFAKGGYFCLQPFSASSQVLNIFRTWKGETGYDKLYPDPKPFNTLGCLFRQISSIIKSATNGVGRINYDTARNNAEFKNFEEMVCKLQLIELDGMDEELKKTFFINVYNLMMTHAFVRFLPKKINSNFLAHISYKIGDFVFSLDDIYHGILRSNSRHPKTNTRMFLESDPRAVFSLRKKDPRVHFALDKSFNKHALEYLYHKETIEEELCLASKFFCESNERITISANKVILPKFMSTFLSDFTTSGKTCDLLLAISKYLTKERYALLNKMLEKGNKTLPVHFQDKPQIRDSKLKSHRLKSYNLPKFEMFRRSLQRHDTYTKMEMTHKNERSKELLQCQTLSTDDISEEESKSPCQSIAFPKYISEASNLTLPTMDGNTNSSCSSTKLSSTFDFEGSLKIVNQFSLEERRDDYSAENSFKTISVNQFSLADIRDDYSLNDKSIGSKLNLPDLNINIQEISDKHDSVFENLFNA